MVILFIYFFFVHEQYEKQTLGTGMLLYVDISVFASLERPTRRSNNETCSYGARSTRRAHVLCCEMVINRDINYGRIAAGRDDVLLNLSCRRDGNCTLACKY